MKRKDFVPLGTGGGGGQFRNIVFDDMYFTSCSEVLIRLALGPLPEYTSWKCVTGRQESGRPAITSLTLATMSWALTMVTMWLVTYRRLSLLGQRHS